MDKKYGEIRLELGCTVEDFKKFLARIEWDETVRLDDLGYDRLVNLWETTGASTFFGSKTEEFDLRTCPYDEYLQTDHWKRVRDEVLKRAKHRCQACNSDGTTLSGRDFQLQCHHRSYQNRGDRILEPFDCIALCKDCHELFHDRPTTK